jgi:bisphosphoglycerate-dependent phosphoglycerate mutase
VVTPNLQLKGKGQVRMEDQKIDATGIVKIDPELSAALIRSVNELRQFLDAQNRMDIPVKVSGTLNRIRIIPDVQGVATQIVAQKAQDLLVNLLD